MSASKADWIGMAVVVRDETGSVLVEWALVGWGLVMGALLFFDTCNALNAYMTLSHIVSEGSKMGARVGALEPGSNTDLSPAAADTAACATAQTTTFPCGHNLIQQRLDLLINALMTNIDKTDVHITTNYIPAGTTGTTQDSTLTVRVTASYQGVLLKGLPIVSTKQAPYLFRSG